MKKASFIITPKTHFPDSANALLGMARSTFEVCSEIPEAISFNSFKYYINDILLRNISNAMWNNQVVVVLFEHKKSFKRWEQCWEILVGNAALCALADPSFHDTIPFGMTKSANEKIAVLGHLNQSYRSVLADVLELLNEQKQLSKQDISLENAPYYNELSTIVEGLNYPKLMQLYDEVYAIYGGQRITFALDKSLIDSLVALKLNKKQEISEFKSKDIVWKAIAAIERDLLDIVKQDLKTVTSSIHDELITVYSAYDL